MQSLTTLNTENCSPIVVCAWRATMGEDALEDVIILR